MSDKKLVEINATPTFTFDLYPEDVDIHLDLEHPGFKDTQQLHHDMSLFYLIFFQLLKELFPEKANIISSYEYRNPEDVLLNRLVENQVHLHNLMDWESQTKDIGMNAFNVIAFDTLANNLYKIITHIEGTTLKKTRLEEILGATAISVIFNKSGSRETWIFGGEPRMSKLLQDRAVVEKYNFPYGGVQHPDIVRYVINVSFATIQLAHACIFLHRLYVRMVMSLVEDIEKFGPANTHSNLYFEDDDVDFKSLYVATRQSLPAFGKLFHALELERFLSRYFNIHDKYEPQVYHRLFKQTVKRVDRPVAQNGANGTNGTNGSGTAGVPAIKRRQIVVKPITSTSVSTSMPVIDIISIPVRFYDGIYKKEQFVVSDFFKFPRNLVIDSSRFLAAGSNGATYIACEKIDGCPVVIKIGIILENEIWIQREAGSAGFGPNILDVFEIEAVSKSKYTVVVMERLDNTMQNLLKSKKFTREDLLKIVHLVRRFAASNFQHHDLKPDNIMYKDVKRLSTDEVLRRWYIIDYGSAWYGGPEYDTQKMWNPPLNTPYGWDLQAKAYAPFSNLYAGWPRTTPFNPAYSWDLACLYYFLATFMREYISIALLDELAAYVVERGDVKIFETTTDVYCRVVDSGGISFDIPFLNTKQLSTLTKEWHQRSTFPVIIDQIPL